MLHAQHRRQAVMTEVQVLMVHAVVSAEQTTGTPLLRIVKRVARDLVHRLRDHGFGLAPLRSAR